MSEQEVRNAVQDNVEQDIKVRKRKNLIGKKQAVDPVPEPEPEVVKLNPSVYVSFFYSTEEGDTGFNNVILSGVPDIRTRKELEEIIGVIKGRHSEYQDIQIIFWRPLER